MEATLHGARCFENLKSEFDFQKNRKTILGCQYCTIYNRAKSQFQIRVILDVQKVKIRGFFQFFETVYSSRPRSTGLYFLFIAKYNKFGVENFHDCRSQQYLYPEIFA